jgi:hypothetical protein
VSAPGPDLLAAGLEPLHRVLANGLQHREPGLAAVRHLLQQALVDQGGDNVEGGGAGGAG